MIVIELIISYILQSEDMLGFKKKDDVDEIKTENIKSNTVNVHLFIKNQLPPIY